MLLTTHKQERKVHVVMHILLNPIIEMISQYIQIQTITGTQFGRFHFSVTPQGWECRRDWLALGMFHSLGKQYFSSFKGRLRFLVLWLVSLKAHVKHLLLIICRIIKRSFEAFECLALTVCTVPVSPSLFCDVL